MQLLQSKRTPAALTLGMLLLVSGAHACSDTSPSSGTFVPTDGGADTTPPPGDTAGPVDTGATGDVDVITSASEVPDGYQPPLEDASTPDVSVTDAGHDVVSVPDTALPDVAAPDAADTAGPVDTGEVDAGPPPELPYVNHCSPAGDGVYNVYDLQDPSCPDHPVLEQDEVLEVEVKGLVTTAVFGDQFFAQEPTGGPYGGIAVYALGSKGTPFQDLVPGDIVTVTGNYKEFFDSTQITASKVGKTGSTAAPTPDLVPDPALVATGGPWAEPYEGCLIAVDGAKIVHTQPDCPYDFGEFVVFGGLRVDDMALLDYTPHLGDELGMLTGVLNYTWGNHKLEPRTIEDLDLLSSGGTGLSKCIKVECVNLPNKPELGNLVVTEIMADPFGEDGSREWFEVQNRSAGAILLAGITVKDCSFKTFQIPLATAVAIPPDGYAVIGASKDPEKNGGAPVDVEWGSGFSLDNGEGAILLFNEVGQLMDYARYASYDPWDFQSGHSLELSDTAANNQEPEGWKAASGEKYGDGGFGSPGAPNPQ